MANVSVTADRVVDQAESAVSITDSLIKVAAFVARWTSARPHKDRDSVAGVRLQTDTA